MAKKTDKKALLRKFAATFAGLRAGAGYTQKQVAEGAGLSVKYVGELERGVANPTVEVLVALAGAFGVGPSALLAGL